MYTKEEASKIRQKFWTSFGKYMQPVPSASVDKVNWINYKTGIKGISFKLNADNNKATVAIEISLVNTSLQHQYFDICANFKSKLAATAGVDWQMDKYFVSEYNKEISVIFTELNSINIYRESDWSTIIAFLKQHIIALDIFWNEYKVAFEIIN
jgi:Domain of unknown function (DUF4268)